MMKQSPEANGRLLLPDDTFVFECRPDLSCFTRCCRDADMYLYPYDIIRLKNRLDLSSDQFLNQHTTMAFRDNPYFPNVMLKMSDRQDRSCPFLDSSGCSVYADRPFSCRAYPMERAVRRTGTPGGPEEMAFIVRHSYCLGHEARCKWTLADWIENQQIQIDNDINDRWVEIDTLFRRNPWGSEGIEGPKLKMAFMACFNIDQLRNFILESTFLKRFEVEPRRKELMLESDIELLQFGFDWVEFFLTGKGSLSLKAVTKS